MGLADILPQIGAVGDGAAENFSCFAAKLRQTVTTETTGVRIMAFRYLATCAVFVFIGAIVIGLL